MHSQTIEAAELLADAPRVDTPERSYRVSRCVPCGQAYAWKGSAPRPGCPLCGQTIGTTTRRLRQPFVVLEGELLALAERVPGGLQASADWERQTAERALAECDAADAKVASGEYELDEDGTAWQMRDPYDFELARGITGRRRSSGFNIAARRARAAKDQAKAAKYEARLAKIGGAVS